MDVYYNNIMHYVAIELAWLSLNKLAETPVLVLSSIALFGLVRIASYAQYNAHNYAIIRSKLQMQYPITLTGTMSVFITQVCLARW